MYYAKKIYTSILRYARRYSTSKRERALAERDKEYIRSKRSVKYLPDAWTNTRWIKRKKSWKATSKKSKQYNEHKLSNYELRFFFNNANRKEEFLFKLKILKDKDPTAWKYLNTNEQKTFFYDDRCQYEVAFQLYEEGIIIGECVFDGDNEYPILIRCKLP